MRFSACLHACGFRRVCTRAVFGVFARVRFSACLHACGFRRVCTRAAFGVFARVRLSACLHACGFRRVCTRAAFGVVCTRAAFGVFARTFLVCVLAPGFVLQYTPIILRMPGSRKKVDFDYAVHDKSGKKALKDRDHKMATPDLRVQANHITNDIDDFFDSYQIENLMRGMN